MLISLTNCQIWDKSKSNNVPIIIVTYNREEAFKKCILSLYNSTNRSIYIIDNSEGKLDDTLNWASQLSKNIKIIKNNKNIGKAASIKKHDYLLKNSQWFITMDPDVIVNNDDIENLIKSANYLLNKGYPISLLSPALNSGNNPISQQITTKQLDTHKIGTMFHLENGLYINEYLAGCLLLVNTLFYNIIGGFTQLKLYGCDDGELSKKAIQTETLSILNTNIECIHYRLDETPDYIQWKIDNIKESAENQSNYLGPINHNNTCL